MSRFLVFFPLILLLNFSIVAQVNDHNKRQHVLGRGVVDSLFVFGKWNEKGQTETHLKYLGQVTSSNGRIFKIMNSSLIWGLSHRATSSILIFNDKNQYVGNYYLASVDDLPDKLENGYLVFTNYDNESCDKKLITKVDFTKELPKYIFLKCKGKWGDLYHFSSE